jgi:hypothetical protein
MFYGGQIGLAKVLERMQEFQMTYGKAVADGKGYRELGL